MFGKLRLLENIDNKDNMDTNLNNIFRYAELVMDMQMSTKLPNVLAYIPEITEDSYYVGYINRYFIQKANDDNSPITEIEQNQENEILSDSYYKLVNIKWRLTGTPQEIMDSNKASIALVNSEMKNLKLYLSNLLQFAKV
jgi:hypothetical protein